MTLWSVKIAPERTAIMHRANLLFPYFLIIAIGVLCYSGTFDASFNFDDIPNIVQKESIRNPLDIKSIWAGSKTRFVADFSFAINYAVNGLQPFGYHLVNLIIHILTAITLYWFVILLFITPELRKNPLARHAKGIALAVALVFTSHPIETQAVTYIVQRITSLASLFYLLSLALYLKARLYYDQNNRRHSLFYAGSLAAALLAMFTKEISVTLPICILIVEYFFFSPSFPMIWRRVKYLWPMLLTLLVVPINYLASMGYLVRHFGVAAETDTISRMDYLLTQFNVIRTYLRLLIFPANQSVDYSYPISHSFLEPATFASFLLLVSLLALAFFLFRKFRLLSFGIVWFFLTLLVESSVIPIRDVIFEHRLYLPSMGIFLAITVLVFYALGKKPRILFALFALVVLLASLGTVHRNVLWKRQVLLWHDAVKKAPLKARAYLNRGVGYGNLNKDERAFTDYQKVITLDKTDALPHLNLAVIYMEKGEYELAISEYDKALRIQPSIPENYFRRGSAYMSWGRYNKAYDDFRSAAAMDPRNPSYLNALGLVCHELQRYDLARLAFTRAIALNHRKAKPYLNRGKTHRSMGRVNAAINDFNRAADLSPDLPETYYHRALAFLAIKKYREAIEDFTRAITRNSRYVKAYANRAMAYHRLGLNERALVDLNKAIALDPSLPKLYLNRASVFRALGREEEAGNDRNKAVDLERE